MRYFTNEWYQIMQNKNLHYGLRAHKEADEKSESTYQRLRKLKEKAFLKSEKEFKEFYEFNPSSPFDVQKCKAEFLAIQEYLMAKNESHIPKAIYDQIADPRVFALGYSTKSIIKQLKKQSLENSRFIEERKKAFSEVEKAENISDQLLNRFRFHDSTVLEVDKNSDITFFIDPSGYTEDNRIIFHDAQILHEEKSPIGGIWLYEELYRRGDGFELHMLFSDEISECFEAPCFEVTIAAKEITVDRI